MSLFYFNGLIILAVKQSCDVLKMCIIQTVVLTTFWSIRGVVIFLCVIFKVQVYLNTWPFTMLLGCPSHCFSVLYLAT